MGEMYFKSRHYQTRGKESPKVDLGGEGQRDWTSVTKWLTEFHRIRKTVKLRDDRTGVKVRSWINT